MAQVGPDTPSEIMAFFWMQLLWWENEDNMFVLVRQMFRNEMGPKVLSLTSDMKAQGLRTYAHCHPTKKGRATMLFVNVRSTN